MKILAIDTSSKICSVAIVDNNSTLVLLENDDEKTHSQKLMPMIDESFKKTGLNLSKLDLLSVCQGPGSFTGIRIGISTIKAFHDACNIPAVGVSSLEAIANSLVISNPDLAPSYIASIIDAKNKNVYFELFKVDNNTLVNVIDAQALNIEDVIITLKKYNTLPIYFIGDGADIYESYIKENLSFSNINFVSYKTLTPSSISIANFAMKKYSDGYNDNLLPVYLRKSQAERNLEGEK